MFLNRSITTQFTIVFVVALLLIVGSFYLVLESVYRSQLKSQAETVADNVDAFGSWVSQYGRVWVRDDDKSYLGQVTLVSAPDPQGAAAVPGAPAPALWHFYSKNPALAQREFSEVVEKSASPAKFRVTSHNFMNPVNKPDAFEARALDAIRGKHLAEYYETLPDTYRYARTLYVKASCLSCHASAESAPADVKVRYGTEHGFGFREGEVAGIISVRLPTRSFWSVATSVVGPLQIALLLGAFLIAVVFIQFAVVRPVRRLTAAAGRISVGEQADLGVSRIARKSGNEIHQLILATERLRASLVLAIQRSSRRQPPPPPPAA
ncbi:MAG: c-type heme family protein [Casimicrobiaceae bacterium]